jgi:hypothetical protein
MLLILVALTCAMVDGTTVFTCIQTILLIHCVFISVRQILGIFPAIFPVPNFIIPEKVFSEFDQISVKF